MLRKLWTILKSAGQGYIAHDSLSRGAAIAYYTVFSLAPVLVIVIAVAGLLFGADAARGAIADQVSGLMGKQGAEALQTMIQNASSHKSGLFAVIGVVTLIITASGVFSEMQAALNVVWAAVPRHGTVMELVRVRVASLGLVLTLGFLLAVSLVVSAALTALGSWLNGLFPGAETVLHLANLVVSLLLISVLFAVIYKVLPDTDLAWRDVLPGAVATSLLFTIGKFLISLYIGASSTASTFGAAGALAILLLWIYYSSQIFLFGAELTRAYGETVHGTRATPPPAVPRDPVAHLEARLKKAAGT